MAKISLNKITPVKKVEPIIVKIGETDIEIKRYLPINEKALMSERVLKYVIDDTGFLNPIRFQAYFYVELIRTYTNINITDKMIENIDETYDALEINGIFDTILEAMDEDEYNNIFDFVNEAAEHAVGYLTSFAGVVKAVGEDYKNTDMNIDETVNKISNPDQLKFVKDVLDKLG